MKERMKRKKIEKIFDFLGVLILICYFIPRSKNDLHQ